MLPCSKKWKVTQTKCVDFDVAEKRKAETPVVADGNDPNEAPSHSTGKKRRIEWRVGTTTEESNDDEFPVDGNHKHHKFWCQMCRVRTTTEALMKEHRNGNEHEFAAKIRRGHHCLIHDFRGCPRS